MKMICIFLGIVFTGCMFSKTSYIYVKNIGEKDIDEVAISSQAGFHFSYGSLMPNKGAGYIGGYDYSYHDEYTVSWIDSEKKRHSKTIDLRPKIAKRFSGNIKLIFKIDGYNNVTFNFKKR